MKNLKTNSAETESISLAHDFSQTEIQPLHKKRVLLIEDDATTRRMVSNALGRYCRIIEAPSAGIAVSKYIHFEPDIVFMDIRLPDGNGHNLLNWIMANDPGAYVVMFSGRTDSDNIMRAMESNARGFVSKPFDIDLMLYHIGRCPKTF